ncbi:MAG: hypothetical protein KKA84_05815 [Bacteroidetes bacterium]|nr:hypothetical protein [Bacteroidota bacterium]
MISNQLDKSNYFRSLLLLIGIDKGLSIEEKQLLRKVGILLGFDKTFTEESMTNFLENEHIPVDPPKFSNIKIASGFIKDGIKFASSDGNICQSELNWLKSIVETNNLSEEWFSQEIKNKNNQFDPNNTNLNLEANTIFNEI